MILATLLQVADKLKLDARPLRADPENLREVPLPAILHWGLNHFVLLTAMERRGGMTRYLRHLPTGSSRRTRS
ncbi:cysteine peptidase family C39 domain-containing protein [Sphingomonas sp. 37zxx]|uniref:cysteine peptidase family C39 domain-containing protein n=1 Tax=Sphingomonas sp. 37zxx TaxID=1550073 RepID=UPI0018CF7D53